LRAISSGKRPSLSSLSSGSRRACGGAGTGVAAEDNIGVSDGSGSVGDIIVGVYVGDADGVWLGVADACA
jgi:hypothetical protein